MKDSRMSFSKQLRAFDLSKLLLLYRNSEKHQGKVQFRSGIRQPPWYNLLLSSQREDLTIMCGKTTIR